MEEARMESQMNRFADVAVAGTAAGFAAGIVVGGVVAADDDFVAAAAVVVAGVAAAVHHSPGFPGFAAAVGRMTSKHQVTPTLFGTVGGSAQWQQQTQQRTARPLSYHLDILWGW